MTQMAAHSSAEIPAVQARPVIRTLKRDDVVHALEAGWRDFKAAPQYGLVFGLLYTLGGWAIIALANLSGIWTP